VTRPHRPGRPARGVYLSDQPRQPWRRCPICDALHDGMLGVNDRQGRTPDEGAVLICADCGEFGLLDSTVEGGWRPPTFTERQEILDNDSIRIAVAATRAMIAERRR
jgi:hypothetical protein